MLHRLQVDETIIQSPHSISSIDPYTDSIELVVHRNHLDSNLSMNIGNERDQRTTHCHEHFSLFILHTDSDKMVEDDRCPKYPS